MTPEALARIHIDQLLQAAGWQVHDLNQANLKRYKASILKAAVKGRIVETKASIAQREGRSYEMDEMLLKRILEKRKVLPKGERVPVNQPKSEGLPDCTERWTGTTDDE